MILQEIAEAARKRVAAEKEQISLQEMKEQALSMPKGDFSFEKVIASGGIHFICEVKKASPSKGVIAEEFPYLDIAKSYDIFCFLHILKIGITHTAYTDSGNVQLISRSYISVRFSKDGTRND